MDDIKLALTTLSPEEIAQLRTWLDELEGRMLNERIARDATSGKLDWLAEEGLAEHVAGNAKNLR